MIKKPLIFVTILLASHIVVWYLGYFHAKKSIKPQILTKIEEKVVFRDKVVTKTVYSVKTIKSKNKDVIEQKIETFGEHLQTKEDLARVSLFSSPEAAKKSKLYPTILYTRYNTSESSSKLSSYSVALDMPVSKYVYASAETSVSFPPKISIGIGFVIN